MTRAEYWEVIRKLMVETPDGGHNPHESMHSYFLGHLARFDWQWDVIEKYVPSVASVYDLGTKFPFISYWLYLRDHANVIYGAPDRTWTGKVQGAMYAPINLCSQQYPTPAALVICTEVLEHLPCNIREAWKRVLGMTEKYLLVSFPLHGFNAKDYEKDDLGDHNHEFSGHIREFTYATSDEFLKEAADFTILAQACMPTAAYRAPIRNVLMERLTWS